MTSLFTPAELADTMSPEDYRWMLDEAAEEMHAENGYVRWLENAGYEEARLQEDMEARMGIFQ